MYCRNFSFYLYIYIKSARKIYNARTKAGYGIDGIQPSFQYIWNGWPGTGKSLETQNNLRRTDTGGIYGNKTCVPHYGFNNNDAYNNSEYADGRS